MAGTDDEDPNDGVHTDGAAGLNIPSTIQSVSRNHKEPKIFDIQQDNPLYKYAADIITTVRTQATRKSNITKVSNQIKTTLLEMEDNCFLGLDPEGSSITDAQTEITDFQTKLKDSWGIFNDLNLRVHEILDTFLTEPGSETYTTDASFIKSKSDEEKQKYKKINKALKNKIDDVNKKIADLIERKNGTGTHASRPTQPSASATSSRSSSPR